MLVSALALRPPNFLQVIIVFASAGFASTFLCPMLLGLYWRGMTRQGALCSMVGGFVVVVGLSAGGRLVGLVDEINLLGLHPVIWGLLSSLVLAVAISRFTGPPPRHLVERYFYRRRD
jgi:Na+/pantothenate symporter